MPPFTSRFENSVLHQELHVFIMDGTLTGPSQTSTQPSFLPRPRHRITIPTPINLIYEGAVSIALQYACIASA